MKRKGWLFLGLLALIPFTTGCNKNAKKSEALGTTEIREIVNNLKLASQKVKNVQSVEQSFVYIEGYGSIEESYTLDKKIYDDNYSIASGIGTYVQGFSFNLEYDVFEQVFRSGNNALLIHDGSDSGQQTLSYKKTQALTALPNLIYSGVDTEDITALREALNDEEEVSKISGLRDGNNYSFRYTTSAPIGGGYSYELLVEVKCRKSGLDYSLLSYHHLEKQLDRFDEEVMSYDFSATYTNSSNGKFTDVENYQDQLLNPNDYAEAYPDMDVEDVGVEGNVPDEELTFVTSTEALTATATAAKVRTEMTYYEGTYAGILIVNEEDLKLYKDIADNPYGVIYGTGTETYYAASRPGTAILNYPYTVQETVDNFEMQDSSRQNYRYKLRDYNELGLDDSASEEDDPGYTLQLVGKAISDSALANTVVDFRDTSLTYYSDCIGMGYNNVSYAAVKDESAGTYTFYMNLAFQQTDESPAVVQKFVAVYSLTGQPISIEYYEAAYYETNIDPEAAYYTYKEKTEFSYDDEVTDTITPLNPHVYLGVD